jgi:ferredoxin/flavodoxin---NADP+ reductase
MTSASQQRPRAAIVGAGPAGFYATDLLLDHGFAVDVFDRLPTPFGLVRSGVAPDHPRIKSVTRVYEATAKRDHFRYFGCLEVGRDLQPAELRSRYHAVVYAVGMTRGRKLGVPGENLRGCHPASDFIGWYNGHPDFSGQSYALMGTRAVVIGNGNVALDVARMLLLPDDQLSSTDVADHALTTLRNSSIRDVIVLGRRGPLEAAFTNPELRELGELDDVEVVVDSDQVILPELAPECLDDQVSTRSRRNLETLRLYATSPREQAERRIVLRFLTSPVEVIGDGAGRVRAVRVACNRLAGRPDGGVVAEPTGVEDLLDCGLVIHAVGYRGRPLPGIPFDNRRGVVPNADGRVLQDGEVKTAEYVVGWIKRGATGVIGTNRKDAAGTVEAILDDLHRGALPTPAHEPDEAWTRTLPQPVVSWRGWEAIDAEERATGRRVDRPRVKLVRLSQLTDVALRAMTRTAA